MVKLNSAQKYTFRTGVLSNGGIIPGPFSGYMQLATFISIFSIDCVGDVSANDTLGCVWITNTRVVLVGDWDYGRSISASSPPNGGGKARYMVIGYKAL